MKIWCQHASEHSAKLVMIGHFIDAAEANAAMEIITELKQQVSDERDAGTLIMGDHSEHYSDEIRALLIRRNFFLIGPSEFEQFMYDVTVNVEENKIILRSDEVDIVAFLKVMFHQGARIEIYSAHSHPDTSGQ